MAPVKQQRYSFSPESIVELRKRLSLSQAKLATSLGIPQNTVSRWETGATTPDATSLAAIHSIAMERGITPSFFKKRKKQIMKPTRMLVVWDFPNLAAQIQHLPHLDAWLRAELEERFSTTAQRKFKAFVRSTPGYSFFDPTETLENHDWDVWEESDDLDEKIIHHCSTYCGQDPSRTILVLITRDGGYAEMINELKSRGVRVYLLGVGHSQDLIDAASKNHLIELPWPDSFPRFSSDPLLHPWIVTPVIGWS